jgi:CubicO group peptidase (beta-lactamase class C family)
MDDRSNDVAQHSDVASNIALLDVWLRAKMAYQGLPGTVVGIVHDQELIYAKGFGVSDVASGTPVGPDSIFRIASHSKLFTAISIMQLRDQGKLRLDDRIADQLPWFAIPPSPDAHVGLAARGGLELLAGLSVSERRASHGTARRAASDLPDRDALEVLEPGADAGR